MNIRAGRESSHVSRVREWWPRLVSRCAIADVILSPFPLRTMDVFKIDQSLSAGLGSAPAPDTLTPEVSFDAGSEFNLSFFDGPEENSTQGFSDPGSVGSASASPPPGTPASIPVNPSNAALPIVQVPPGIVIKQGLFHFLFFFFLFSSPLLFLSLSIFVSFSPSRLALAETLSSLFFNSKRSVFIYLTARSTRNKNKTNSRCSRSMLCILFGDISPRVVRKERHCLSDDVLQNACLCYGFSRDLVTPRGCGVLWKRADGEKAARRSCTWHISLRDDESCNWLTRFYGCTVAKKERRSSTLFAVWKQTLSF